MAQDGRVVPGDPLALLGVKKKTQSSRSLIRLDATGQCSILNVDKYAIMHRVAIHGRDLRILDPMLSYPSTILGREHALVLNLEHIKAIITTEETSSLNLDRVRKIKSAMTRLTARVQKVRDVLEQLLDDDDDMADLYLSRKLDGISSPTSGSGVVNWLPRSPTIASKISRASRSSMPTVHGDENDVEELEMLLEAYFMHIESALNKLNTLRDHIDHTEEYINLELNNRRNNLIKLELVVATLTVFLSVYSLLNAIFGMNIPYEWNKNHDYMFKWVVIDGGVACAVMFLLVMISYHIKGLI